MSNQPICLNTRFGLHLLICFLFLSFAACSVKAQDAVIRVSAGYLKGKNEAGTLVFKGIPYAAAPVGNLRFRAPQPAAAWKDTLACDTFGKVAAQFNGSLQQTTGAEDCLTLNVYSPVPVKQHKLPVLVWIHGGGMTGGSGKGMDGHAFAGKDSIVTVTINYRLGVFGFLYLGDQQQELKSSGNNGLLDCIMALKWIRENIAAFGGDPAKVTVMGESAGAKLASTLLLTSRNKNYFNQMVLESGSVQCVRDTLTAKAIRQRLLDTLQLSSPAALLKLSTAQLIAAQNKVCGGARGTNYFGPVADGEVISGDPYLYLKQNPNRDLRFLIGTNKTESRMFMDMDKRLYHPEQSVLYDWFGNNAGIIMGAWQKAVRHADTLNTSLDLLTQYMYQMHAYRLAETLALNGNPVWMYRFDYNREGTGATHAQELPYVWFTPGNTHFNEQELQLAGQVHHAWVNFIRGRKPGNLNHFDWSWYKPRARSVMVFDQQVHPELLTELYNDTQFPSAGFILQ